MLGDFFDNLVVLCVVKLLLVGSQTLALHQHLFVLEVQFGQLFHFRLVYLVAVVFVSQLSLLLYPLKLSKVLV